MSTDGLDDLQARHPDPDQVFNLLAWQFNIDAADELILTHGPTLKRTTVTVADVLGVLPPDPLTATAEELARVPVFSVDIDFSHIDLMDHATLEQPLIVIPFNASSHWVIDGWHRIALARRLGVAELPGVMLTREQTAALLTPGSPALPD